MLPALQDSAQPFNFFDSQAGLPEGHESRGSEMNSNKTGNCPGTCGKNR